MSWIEAVDGRLVALVALALQLVAAEVGWRFGMRRPPLDMGPRFQASSVQAAILALLGLLLAFTFSMAAVRYETRRTLVVEESSAIGTAYLQTRILPDEERETARDLLRRYVHTRIAFYGTEDRDAVAEAVRASETILGELWTRVNEPAVEAFGTITRADLVKSTSQVIDLHVERVAADEARVPPRILVLLVSVAVAALGTVGWCFASCRGAHRGPCLLLAGIVAALLFVIVDLDEPRHGRIRVDMESMLHLQELFGR